MREWKRERASELGFNDPCVICHNRTLCEIVRSLPETEVRHFPAQFPPF